MTITRGQQKKINHRMALVAGFASMATVAFLIVIKFIAFWQSGSTSVLASLIDSGVDASISIMTFMAIRLSLKPADHDHRHGHGKVEGLAALFQAAFIAGAGVFLLFESIRRATNHEPVTEHFESMIVMGISAFMSVLLVLVQRYVLRHAPSLAVEADKANFSADIIVNLGVIAVLAILYYGGPAWIDPLFAIFVSLYLVVTAKSIAVKACDMLLDRELSGDVREIITKKVLSHQYVLGMHDLRTHKSGMGVFISFDIELDPSLLLYNAHEIVREVEHDLIADFPHAEILIHIDPYGDTDDTRHKVAGVHL